MKKFTEIIKEDRNRMNAAMSRIPEIPINTKAGLNNDQSEALKSLLSGENCFLTGSAGTGKSFLLRRFMDLSRAASKSVLVAAPTKIAARHLDGRTLHSTFNVPFEEDGILSPNDCAFEDIADFTSEEIAVLVQHLHRRARLAEAEAGEGEPVKGERD
jgi:hypothetical protein